MNNYVSKANAIGLKEIGYNEDSFAFYRSNEPFFEIGSPAVNCNIHDDIFSAPDFLQAADWLWEKHEIEIIFYAPGGCVVSDKKGINRIDILSPDARNLSIARAIEIIRERK